MNSKNDIFQKYKVKKQKLSTTMNRQHTQKIILCNSKMSKLRKHSVAKTSS